MLTGFQFHVKSLRASCLDSLKKFPVNDVVIKSFLNDFKLLYKILNNDEVIFGAVCVSAVDNSSSIDKGLAKLRAKVSFTNFLILLEVKVKMFQAKELMVPHVHCTNHCLSTDVSEIDLCWNSLGFANNPISASKKCLYCQKSFCDHCLNMLTDDCSPEICELTEHWTSSTPWTGCMAVLDLKIDDLRKSLESTL